MRKKMVRQTFLLLLLAGIVFACVYEDDSSNFEEGSLIEEAQRWYEEQRTEPIDAQLVKESPNVSIEPEWKYPWVKQKGEYATVEVPILSDRSFSFIDPESMKKYEETKDKRYKSSGTHLVFRKNLRTNAIDGFIMTISPSLNYLEANDFNPFRKNTYLYRDKDFDGFIFYHDLNGNFVNGWKYVDGDAFSISLRDNSETTLRNNTCTAVYAVYLVSDCWYQLLEHNDGLDYYDIHCKYSLEYHFLFATCYDNGTGDGGYDPDGVGGGNPNKEPQERNDCPPSAAANSNTVNNVLGKTNGIDDQVKSNINLLRNYAKTKTNEWGLSVVCKNGVYTVLDQKRSSNQSSFYIKEGGETNILHGFSKDTYLIAHTHPTGNAAPSPNDIIYFVSAYKGLPAANGEIVRAENIHASLIFASDGSEYMIYVDNDDMIKRFCENSMNSGFFDSNGALFAGGTLFGTTYEDVCRDLRLQGYSQNDAQSYALSYVLNYFNTGLKIYYKKNGETDFKEQYTGVDVCGSNLTYIPKKCK